MTGWYQYSLAPVRTAPTNSSETMPVAGGVTGAVRAGTPNWRHLNDEAPRLPGAVGLRIAVLAEQEVADDRHGVPGGRRPERTVSTPTTRRPAMRRACAGRRRTVGSGRSIPRGCRNR